MLLLYTERFTCCIIGPATAVTAAVVAVVAVVAVAVLTLTHRYSAVRGHRTCSNNLYSSSSVQYARNSMRLFSDETLAVRRPNMLPVRTFGFLEECLYHRPLGVWLF